MIAERGCCNNTAFQLCSVFVQFQRQHRVLQGACRVLTKNKIERAEQSLLLSCLQPHGCHCCMDEDERPNVAFENGGLIGCI